MPTGSRWSAEGSGRWKNFRGFRHFAAQVFGWFVLSVVVVGTFVGLATDFFGRHSADSDALSPATATTEWTWIDITATTSASEVPTRTQSDLAKQRLWQQGRESCEGTGGIWIGLVTPPSFPDPLTIDDANAWCLCPAAVASQPGEFLRCALPDLPIVTVDWDEFGRTGQSGGVEELTPLAYRTGATCADGSSSGATGRGACSWHGGVLCWRFSDGSCRRP